MKLIPSEDGVTHINVYSKGKTEVGRFLSNFSYSPVETQDGHFDSIEGYWYWLGCTHPNKDKLRSVFGWKAKELGRELDSPDWIEDRIFKLKICNAIQDKIYRAPQNMVEAMKDIKDRNLPLTHYYVFGSKVIEPKDGKWVIDFLEDCIANIYLTHGDEVQ